jgi:hypothetical protein
VGIIIINNIIYLFSNDYLKEEIEEDFEHPPSSSPSSIISLLCNKTSYSSYSSIQLPSSKTYFLVYQPLKEPIISYLKK